MRAADRDAVELGESRSVTEQEERKERVVIYQCYEINTWKGWVGYQAKTLNLSNIVLLVVVAVVSSSISSTLTRLQDQNSQASTLLADTSALLAQAKPISDQLASAQSEISTLNQTFSQIQSQSLRFSSHNILVAFSQNLQTGFSMTAQTLQTFSWNASTTSDFASLTQSGSGVTLNNTGWYKVKYMIREFDNGDSTLSFRVTLGFALPGQTGFKYNWLTYNHRTVSLWYEDVLNLDAGTVLIPAVMLDQTGTFYFYEQKLIVELLFNIT